MINASSLVRSYGDYLNQYSWDWYAILTFRNMVSSRLAFKLFNKWKVQLKKSEGCRIDYVLVIEPTRFRANTPHLHVLLHGINHEKPYVWEQRWFAIGGLAKIKLYNPDLGASYYIGRKIATGVADLFFSRSLEELSKMAI